MTIAHFMSVISSSIVSIVPTLSGGTGGTVSQSDAAPYTNTLVAIRFNVDGTVETGKSRDGAATTWSAAGNWIDPTSEADSTYSVRFTNLVVNSGSGDWTTEAAADNTWINLGSQRLWRRATSAAGLSDFDCDFEVRKTAGAPPSTGSAFYSFIINNIF